MSKFTDWLGTSAASWRIGLGATAVRLKNIGSALAVRNAADSADAPVTASKVNVSGDEIDINSDAAGAGADWKYTLKRPSSGMSAAVSLTLPPDDGTAGQVLQTDGDGVLTWVSAGSTTLADKLDTTSLAFGSASPVTMFSTGANDVIEYIDVFVDTAFDGTGPVPSMSVGIDGGSASKYMAATQVDLTTAGQYRVHPGLPAQGAEDLEIAFTAGGGASAGAARVVVHYAQPA